MASAPPTVSVVIPTYNRAAYLREAIESVLRVKAQVADVANLEIIVVDDASTDDTADVVAQYPAVYQRNVGRGVSAARNTGIRAATGEFVAFLDDDDVWLDGHIRQHLEVLKANPGVAFAYAQGVLTDASLNPVYPPAPAAPLPGGDIFIPLLRQCMHFNTILIRKEVLDEIGGFDERLTGAEDWDLELRVAARYDGVGLTIPVSLYRQHDAIFRGYDAWTSHFRQNMEVLRRCTRLPARQPLRLSQRLFLTFAVRGWFAYRFLVSAQVALATGRRFEALKCLVGAMQASPMHACFRVSGYWQTVAALVVPALGRPRGAHT